LSSGDFTTLSPTLSNWIAPRCRAGHGQADYSKDDDAVLELLHSININRTKEGIHEVNRLLQGPSGR